MTNDMMAGKLTLIIRFVVMTLVLFFMRTEALITNIFYSARSTGCDRNDKGIRQPELKPQFNKF